MEMISFTFGNLKRFWILVTIAAVLAGPFAFLAPTAEAVTQNAYRWRNDDGSESAATFAAAANTGITTEDGINQRVRFGAANNGTEAELLRIGGVSFSAGEGGAYSMVIDRTRGYAYIGTQDTPAKIVKIDLSTFTRVGSITLNSGENSVLVAVIDEANGYAYFGTGDPAVGDVIKVDINHPTFSRVGAIAFNAGETELSKAVIDTDNGFAYFAAHTTPSIVVKVDVSPSNFARVGAVTLSGGENFIRGGVIDMDNDFAYFSTETAPAKVIKVNTSPSGFARVGAIDLSAGENGAWAAVIDTDNDFAYFGTNTSPARVVKVNTDPSGFARVGAVTLNAGENGALNAVIDTVNDYGYFTTYDTNQLVKVNTDPSGFARSGSVALTVTDSFPTGIDVANGYVYVGTITSTGTVQKVSIAPKPEFRIEYGEKVSTCAAISSWTQVPATATTEHWEMGASANITNGGATTDNAGLANGNTNFKAGRIHDTSSQAAEVSIGEKEFTEMEYSVAATLDAEGEYCFRLTDAGSMSGFTFTNYAEASIESIPTNDSTIDNNISADRFKAGAAATMSIQFTLQNTLSGTLTVTFPAGFTINSVPGTGSSGCLSDFGFSGQTATAVKTSCSGTIVFAGINVTNPVTPGLYKISWVNDDPGEGGVAIVDDDQVTVSADVAATITFDIDAAVTDTDTDSPYTVGLGAVPTSSVRVSGTTDSVPFIWLELSTNATSGAVVTVRNANGASGLVSASEPSDTIANAAGAMSAGTEKYGLCVAAATAGVGTLSKAGDYATGTCAGNSETNDVENLTTSAASIVSASAPVSAAQAQIAVQAAAGPVTEAHNDYSDTLTFVATGTF